MRWTIYYEGGVKVDGSTRYDWLNAPVEGVQVVVEWREPCHPCPDGRSERRFSGVDDRVLHTGEDVYDPFGWDMKFGSLIPDEDYERIWNEAAHG